MNKRIGQIRTHLSLVFQPWLFKKLNNFAIQKRKMHCKNEEKTRQAPTQTIENYIFQFPKEDSINNWAKFNTLSTNLRIIILSSL